MIFMMIAHQQFVLTFFSWKWQKKVVGWEQDIITKNADKDDAFDANDADAFASITFGDSLIGRFKGPCPRVVIIGPWKGSFFFFQYLNFDDDDQMDVIVNFIKQFPHMEKRVIFISIMTKMSKHALHFAGVFIGMVPSLKNKIKKNSKFLVFFLF